MRGGSEETMREVLSFIDHHASVVGYAPSQHEIARHMKFAGVRAVQYRLEQLESRGWVERTPGVARSLRLTQAGMFALSEVAA